jgi:hypothetical protein
VKKDSNFFWYGDESCIHVFVPRSDANKRDGYVSVICKHCGRFGYLRGGSLHAALVRVTSETNGGPLPSNANFTGNWKNPFCIDSDIKVWI